MIRVSYDKVKGGTGMDIAALSMSLSNMELGTQVSVAVMNLGKSQLEQTGGKLVQDLRNLELSVNPNVGSSIDISI